MGGAGGSHRSNLLTNADKHPINPVEDQRIGNSNDPKAMFRQPMITNRIVIAS